MCSPGKSAQFVMAGTPVLVASSPASRFTESLQEASLPSRSGRRARCSRTSNSESCRWKNRCCYSVATDASAGRTGRRHRACARRSRRTGSCEAIIDCLRSGSARAGPRGTARTARSRRAARGRRFRQGSPYRCSTASEQCRAVLRLEFVNPARPAAPTQSKIIDDGSGTDATWMLAMPKSLPSGDCW